MSFITGYSGRFPDADNVHELYDALRDKRDLISEAKRYPPEYHGLPARAGHLKTINKFDNKFFKMNKLHVEGIDPQIRMLMEVTYEAIADSGLSMAQLKGTNTGVYIGHCFSDYHNGVIKNIDKVNGYENVGSANSMAANKLSYFFGFHGPSFTIDTACSSSLVALDRACQDIESGLIDRAIVGGLSLNLRPTISKVFQKYNMMSPTGTCHSFDESADGYCRSETIAVLLVESDKVRSTGYARIAGHGVNTNGSHTQGITFPSVSGQCGLIEQVVKKYNIDTSTIGFIETHGTGTTAGDNVEITALDQAYGRADKTVSIGAVKSSVGHAEGASGMNSVIKALLMYETKTILPNIHFNTTQHVPLLNGKFRVVTEVEPFDCDLKIAINNFGFGGVNAHVILENGGRVYGMAVSGADASATISSEDQPCDEMKGAKTTDESDFSLPISGLHSQQCCVFGRTEEGVMMELEANRPSVLTTATRNDIDNFPFRGIKSDLNPKPTVNRVDPGSKISLAYVYSGQGSQYKHMAKSLFLKDDIFHQTIVRLANFLSKISEGTIDLMALFQEGHYWEDKKYSGIGITSVQIALTNMLSVEGFTADYVVGHSMGEIACSYADGCLTEEQCIQISYIRSQLVVLLDSDSFIYSYNTSLEAYQSKYCDQNGCKLVAQENGLFSYQISKSIQVDFEKHHNNFVHKFDNNGAMIFVSMTADQVNQTFADLDMKYSCIACYNSSDGLTLAGPVPEISKFRDYLQSNSVFFREVDTDGIAYHSPLLAPYSEYLVQQIMGVIPADKAIKRSSKWLTSSLGGINAHTSSGLCDADYHTKNITGSVYFYQAIEQLPANTVVVEIGPHAGLLSQVKRTRPDLIKLLPAMSKKDPSAEIAVDKLLNSLWVCGVVSAKLGTEITTARGCSTITPTSNLHLALHDRHRLRWDHDEDWKIVTYLDFENTGNDNSIDITYDLKGADKYLLDHVIQTSSLFPAMGHVYTIWKAVGLSHDVKIDDFQIFRAISIQDAESVSFSVKYDKATGKIEIFNGDDLVSSAASVVTVTTFQPFLAACDSDEASFKDALTGDQIYSIFHRFEYNYQDLFQVIREQSQDGLCSRIRASDTEPLHWISYLDGMLQASINNPKALKLPTSIKSISLRSSDTFPELVKLKGPKANRTITSAVCSVLGLATTTAPPSAQRNSSISSVRFIPYGENLTQDTFVNNYRTNFIKYCHLELRKMLSPTVIAKYPHLANLLRYATKPVYDESVPMPMIDQAVFNITKDLYKDDDLFVNPLLLLSQHPLHNDLYLTDVLFSSSAESLKVVVDILHENMTGKYNFLEVGTGTGGALRRIYPLVRNNIETYIASDISVINIDDNLPKVKPAKWNINDPYPDHIIPKSDVIFGSNSVHCGSDMKSTLSHICAGLTEGGFLILEEYISELPIYLWGLDSFIWETAKDEREHGLWMEHKRWEGLFEQAGLDMLISFNNGATCLYLLRKRPSVNSAQTADRIKVCTMPSLLEAQLALTSGSVEGGVDEAKSGKEGSVVDTMLVVGSTLDGTLGFCKSLAKEPDLAETTVIGYSVSEEKLAAITASNSYPTLPGLALRLKTNVLNSQNVHGSYRESTFLDLQKSNNWHIAIEKPGFLNTLYYQQDIPACVDVQYVGLNFKDVMLSYGKLKLDSDITLGIEYSGVKDGKNVMGISANCLAKQLPVSPLIWSVPPRLTMQEAATLPCVYATVLYCLDHCASIQSNQSILIHAGAGGIGQAAISVCLKRGCTVYTTCSSSKRQFLKDKYGLADSQIGSSRDASFYDFIMTSTNYEGVNVVLNSLSEDMLTLSLDCVAKFGHFCEIGKYDIMNNNKIGLKPFANNVSFHGVDISDMIHEPHYNKILTDLVQKGLDNDEISPINIDSVYAHRDLELALRYMGSGGHMGKIIIDMQEGVASPEMDVKPAYQTSGTHLISGGLGGFGMELAEWLLVNGAQKILLLSRSSGKALNGYQTRKIAQYPGQMKIIQCDVTNEAQMDACISSNSDIVGIWHLAMILQDTLFKNMTRAQWDTCVDVKATAADILDRLSRKYLPDLQDFVLFSSISSLFGNAGQTNYAYANSRMEMLGHKRKAESLPAKVVCWGRIGNVGYLANKGKVTSEDVMVDQHIDSCLADLHTMLRSNYPVMSCYKPSIPDSTSSSANATVLDSILRVLGTDSSKVSDSESLVDLGVDSLQVVTVKSILKGKGVDKAVADIYTLKIGDLRALQ
jgi:acyl transferase domain-containing protein/NADPH:quinone reductase-like Zn-dependent oxidoreductase/aryl carrier-like protein